MGLAYSGVTGVTGVGWGSGSGVGSGVGSGSPTAPIAYFLLRRVARQRAEAVFLFRKPFAKPPKRFLTLAKASRDCRGCQGCSRRLRETSRAVRHAREGFASTAGGGRESLGVSIGAMHTRWTVSRSCRNRTRRVQGLLPFRCLRFVYVLFPDGSTARCRIC